MWILFACGSAFFAGLTAVIAKIGLKENDSDVVTALRTGVVLLFAWLMVFVTGAYRDIHALDCRSLLFLFLSGLATGLSWICFFRALKYGDVNKVTPVDKSSTILTMLLAMVFLNETVTLQKILCMIVIATGTYLMLERKGAKSQPKHGKKSWLLYAVLSAIFASLTSILGKIGVENVDSNLATALRTFVVLVMAWMIVLARGKIRLIKTIDRKSHFFILLSGTVTGLSWLCYYRALQKGPASIVVPIDKLSILVCVLFACFILKERLSKKGVAGLALTVAGTLALLI